MTCAQCQRFPVEIFDLIVDSVQDIYGVRPWSALYACSLVSRAFASRARRHIFREVNLYTWRKESTRRINKFFELLTWGPNDAGTAGGILRIGSIVKCVNLDCVASQTSDMALEGVVISILQVLHRQNPGIESFGFDFQGIWQDLSIGLRQAVWDLFQSPHLKSLSLEYIQVPNTLLLGSAVRHLHLDNIESGDMAESMEHLSTSRRSNLKGLPICSQIESLEIDRPDESHLALLCGGSDSSTLGQFIRLRKLTITVYFFEEEYNYIAPLLSRAEETLVDVKILYGSHMDHPVSPPATVDLGRMKRLKNLTLDSSEHDVGTVLHDYNLLLGQLTAPTTLETLNLHVPLDLQDEDHYTALAPLFQSLGAPSDCNVWTSFNDIISAPFRFTGLRQLVVRVQFVQYLVDDCPGSDANFRDLIKTLIRLALPYFSGDDGAPKLVIDFTTR